MISIVVPVYNASSYILDTIQMVQRQTYADWELILVDDGSGDGSARLIRDYLASAPEESRIRLLCKPVNEGAARARNTGLDAARGRYIAFLDADDLWQSDKLARELSFMKERNAGFVYTAYVFGDEYGNPTRKAVRVPETLTYRQALSRTIIFTSTVLADTEKIDRSLLKMPDVGSEDTATWWRILREGNVAYGLDECLVIYRRPKGGSLSSNKRIAVKRIWNLYRREEGLGFWVSVRCLLGWAARATWRRTVPDWQQH